MLQPGSQSVAVQNLLTIMLNSATLAKSTVFFLWQYSKPHPCHTYTCNTWAGCNSNNSAYWSDHSRPSNSLQSVEKLQCKKSTNSHGCTEAKQWLSPQRLLFLLSPLSKTSSQSPLPTELVGTQTVSMCVQWGWVCVCG